MATYKIGDRIVSTDGADSGRIEAIGGQCDDQHPMNRDGNVWVRWDSLVDTWTPIDGIRIAG